jgi:hypothetical protein
MSFKDDYICDRCKKKITENGVVVNFEAHDSKDEFDLCKVCFLSLIDWIKHPELTKMGPVERIARREDSK